MLDLEDALAAVAAAARCGVAPVLISAPGAGVHAGGPWWRALIDTALAACPTPPGPAPPVAILDCADRPGAVLAALRAGVRQLRCTAEPAAMAKLDLIVRAEGAVLWPEPDAVLELRGCRDRLRSCETWLIQGA